MQNRTVFALMSITAGLSASLGYVLAQDVPEPTGGLASEALAAEGLGPHFECLEGMELLMTRHEIPPNFVGGTHSHLGRPEVFYVLDGSVLEYQGDEAVEYHADDGFVSNADLTREHRIENPNDTSVTVMDVQIIAADR